MKQGKSLTDLAAELERQHSQKRDFITDTRELELIPHLSQSDKESSEPGCLRLNSEGATLDFATTQHTHRQIGTHLNIPAKYYDRMHAEVPALLAYNVNYWFREQPVKRMLRTLDGKARAFLSNRYRRLDNFDLLHAVMPVLAELRDDSGKGLEIISCDVTETKLYLKCIFPKIEAEVKRGDPVQSGIVISNSEVGQGALSVTPLVYRLVCSNGMVAPDYAQRKHHIGRANPAAENAYELFTDETLQADDKAFWLKTRDIVRAAANPVGFEQIVSVLQRSTETRVEQPVKAVEELSNQLSFNQSETQSVLKHFMQDADFSRWGLANAVTRTAEDVSDYDRASAFEEAGWKTLTLANRDWHQVARAA